MSNTLTRMTQRVIGTLPSTEVAFTQVDTINPSFPHLVDFSEEKPVTYQINVDEFPYGPESIHFYKDLTKLARERFGMNTYKSFLANLSVEQYKDEHYVSELRREEDGGEVSACAESVERWIETTKERLKVIQMRQEGVEDSIAKVKQEDELDMKLEGLRETLEAVKEEVNLQKVLCTTAERFKAYVLELAAAK